MAVDEVRVNRLRKDVRRAPFARPLGEREVPGACALLRPQLRRCQAPRAPDPRAMAAANLGKPQTHSN
eukprot:2585932-Alexandrium_andersonii.AAC.1